MLHELRVFCHESNMWYAWSGATRASCCPGPKGGAQTASEKARERGEAERTEKAEAP
jgi:hypothetical protein